MLPAGELCRSPARDPLLLFGHLIHRMLRFALALGLLVLGGCEVFNAEANVRRMRETDAFAQDFLRDLHWQGFASIRDRIDPSALHHFSGSELRELRVALPS